ncbi:MAG: N-6 DNA methylase [Planctomycetia bacterium]|nr:N-6 DNA methylase [Planctomycetia bacterium]
MSDSDSEEWRHISRATERNWKKLQTTGAGRLAARANKSLSSRKFFPREYFSNQANLAEAQEIVQIADERRISTPSVVYSIALRLLERAELVSLSQNHSAQRVATSFVARPHVAQTIAEYSYPIAPSIFEREPPHDEHDWLGLIYQSLLSEGEKNRSGIYFTPPPTADTMLARLDFSHGETLFDPCCGSGAFLQRARGGAPSQLVGVEKDPLAAFICKINLLLKFRAEEFVPQIVCADFFSTPASLTPQKFDYIVTNPPWGALEARRSAKKTHKDAFARFLCASMPFLKEKGRALFLLPESILNVPTHRQIRKTLLETTHIHAITLLDQRFSNVQTSCLILEYTPHQARETAAKIERERAEEIRINTLRKSFFVERNDFYQPPDYIFRLSDRADRDLLRRVFERAPLTLSESLWALGIVTGDNRNKLFPDARPGAEPILTGKDIQLYRTAPPTRYIHFDRAQLQQTADDSFYRAPEKLIYKFISPRPIFAYDASQTLVLNSANILIPRVPTLAMKSVLGFLNSELYAFVYQKLFGGVKMLKGNLRQLPFPRLTLDENAAAEEIVAQIIEERLTPAAMDAFVYRFFGLTPSHIRQIRDEIYSPFA